MAVFSKYSYQLVEQLPCSALHPWTTSCLSNGLGTFLQTLKGSSKFFLLIYLFQLMLKQRYQQEVLTQQALSFCRSCLFGGFCGGSSVIVQCFLRWLRGKHVASDLGLIPGIIGGGGIFIEDPSRRGIDLTLFIALVTDLYLKVFQEEEFFTISPLKEQLIFTFCSCSLLYCLRTIRDSYTLLWPFTPHKLPEDLERRKHCPHKGGCMENIKKIGSTYFCYGLALQTLKVAALHFNTLLTKPILFLRAFSRLSNLRLPLFVGLYITLFQGISCLLRKHRGQDEAWHCFPAAAAASLCYLIQPNLSLALIAFSNLSQIVCRKYRKQIELPAWPWEEMVFMVCMGLMYHARAAYPHCFPRYMLNIMDTATDGRAKIVYGLVEERLLLRI